MRLKGLGFRVKGLGLRGKGLAVMGGGFRVQLCERFGEGSDSHRFGVQGLV